MNKITDLDQRQQLKAEHWDQGRRPRSNPKAPGEPRVTNAVEASGWAQHQSW